jgi:hypothetical protein
MRARGIILLSLLVVLFALPAIAEEEVDTAPDSWVPPTQSQPVGSCHKQCVREGFYDHICLGICDAGDSKNPEKFSHHSYECYKGCVAQGQGVLWCQRKCLGWARTLEMQDVNLPPERGVQ